jgi:hypothetical protein
VCAAKTKAERAEISRQNGAKSRGPKAQDGKDRSKFNARKHGLTAKTVILPGEDAGVFQERLESWTACLEPRDDVELALVERALAACWQVERAERAETARLASNIRIVPPAQALRGQADAVGLGRRLLDNPRHSYIDYIDNELSRELPPRAFGSSALAADPDHAATSAPAREPSVCR